MKFGSTFSIARIPSKIEEMKLGNNWVPMILPVKTSTNFKDNLAISQQMSKEIVGSFDLLGQMFMVKLILLLPYNLASYMFDYLC